MSETKKINLLRIGSIIRDTCEEAFCWDNWGIGIVYKIEVSKFEDEEQETIVYQCKWSNRNIDEWSNGSVIDLDIVNREFEILKY